MYVVFLDIFNVRILPVVSLFYVKLKFLIFKSYPNVPNVFSFQVPSNTNTLPTPLLETRVANTVVVEGIVALLARQTIRIGRAGQILVARARNTVVFARVGLFLVAWCTVTVIKVVVAVAAWLAYTIHRANIIVIARILHAILGMVKFLPDRTIGNTLLSDFGKADLALTIFKVVVAGASVASKRVCGALIVVQAPTLNAIVRSVEVLSRWANTTH